jgi:hypothetical protein
MTDGIESCIGPTLIVDDIGFNNGVEDLRMKAVFHSHLANENLKNAVKVLENSLKNDNEPASEVPIIPITKKS